MGSVMLKNKVREKKKVVHNTLIYKTAVKYLQFYLKERFEDDWVQEVTKPENYSKPLFVGRSGERHDAQYVQQMLRKVAPLTYIANGRFAEADINPIR
jgi:RecA/RadA recombinase